MSEGKFVARKFVFPVLLRVLLWFLYVRLVVFAPYQAFFMSAFLTYLAFETACRVFASVVLAVKGQRKAAFARRAVVGPLPCRLGLVVAVL